MPTVMKESVLQAAPKFDPPTGVTRKVRAKPGWGDVVAVVRELPHPACSDCSLATYVARPRGVEVQSDCERWYLDRQFDTADEAVSFLDSLPDYFDEFAEFEYEMFFGFWRIPS